MKKILTLVCAIGLFTFVANAQDPLSSQYMFNGYLVNPAYSATTENTTIMGGYRNQWTGFEGAPITYYASAYAPIYRMGAALGNRNAMNKLRKRTHTRRPRPMNYGSLGIMAMSDNIGPFSDTKASVSYAYNMVLSGDFEMIAGASIGFKQRSLAGSELITADFDPAIGTYSFTKLGLEASAGIWLYSEHLYGGFAAHRLSTVTGIPFTNFFLTAGASLPIDDNDVFHLVPSFMLRVGPPQPIQADLNCKLWYKDAFWIGASGRTNLTAVGLIGFRVFKTLALGYSYDVPFSEVKLLNNPSHEVWIEVSPHMKGSVMCPNRFW